MPKTFQTCLIHIGTEKTGTSAVQSFLTSNRQVLSEEGFYYPISPSNPGSQWEFVAVAHREPWLSDLGRHFDLTSYDDQKIFSKKLSQNLDKQFQDPSNASTLIISSEHFHSRLATHNMIKKLKEFLDPWVENFKIVVFLRRQDELAISHFSTRVKSGQTAKAFNFPTSIAELDFYRYDRLVNRWADSFGIENIIAGKYASATNITRDLIPGFCEMCGIDISNKKLPARLNTSVNARGLSAIQTLNKWLENTPSNKDRVKYEGLIQIISATHEGKYFPVNKLEAQKFYQRFKDGNEYVRKLLLPTLPSPLFREDFSDYPDRADQLNIDTAQTIETAKKTWRITQRHSTFNKLARSISNIDKHKP